MDPTPRWIRDLTRLLPIRSQAVLSGNLRDGFSTPLTDAKARASGNQPRGALLFAGPTGVGKTEFAKTLGPGG